MIRLILTTLMFISFVCGPAYAEKLNLPITSHYGWRHHPITCDLKFHTGIDLGYELGAVVVAVMEGKVVFAGNYGGYGNTVIIEHKDNRHTLYAHCHRLDVSKGDYLKKGERIGIVGASGNVTGPHLHFELWKDGKYANPLSLWKGCGTDVGKDGHCS